MTTNFDEKGKIFTAVISKKPIPVVLQTTLNRIEGKIYVRPDERIKDELDRTETFLAVTDARIFSLDGQILSDAPFLAVHRAHIVWVLPVESPAE
jgi:hypothetical protein